MNDNDMWRMREDLDRLLRQVMTLTHEVKELRALVTPLDQGSLPIGEDGSPK